MDVCARVTLESMKHPFVAGATVGAIGLLAWWKRAWLVGLARRMRHPLSGSDLTNVPAALETCIRQIRRYAFAASQDQSPIVGLTHASYALISLDTLEEIAGRDVIRNLAGIDTMKVRQFIVTQQDRHAKTLESCDPFLTAVLALERDGNVRPKGLMFGGGAPTGA